ncbi:Tyrosine-protein kinase-like otk [Orchesella cincta]|uniref:Tyrosine-protein kinase-like otk n=1 Tax=Orchesella cincta TaxID=48709 RepID=A0A1D2NN27_ORCCI|nr:Tyrosine-protein kinase-like otk [Orchesella cincta]
MAMYVVKKYRKERPAMIKQKHSIPGSSKYFSVNNPKVAVGFHATDYDYGYSSVDPNLRLSLCHHKESLEKINGAINYKAIWRRCEEIHEIRGDEHTVFSNGSLSIYRVWSSDEGIYKCLVPSYEFSEEEAQIYSASLQIAYIEPLSITTSLDPAPLIPSHKLAVPEKGTVEIFCERPKGLPTPRVWWEGPDGRVILETSSSAQPSSSVSVFSSSRTREPNTLLVPNVRADQTGNYACVAENMEGTSRATVQLVVVTTPPTILGHPSSTVVKEGEEAYFICQFRGPSYPVSQIQWLRNKVPIPARTFLTQDDQADGPILYPVVSSSVDASGGNIIGSGGVGSSSGGGSDQQKPLARFISFPENGTLKIEPVELTDVGDYTCEIMTPGYMTVESRPAQLFVTETLKFMPKPVDRKLELGSTSKIHCKAHGASPLKIRWVKEGQSLFEWPAHIKEVNGTLHFHTVMDSDKGRYTCVATNAEGLINTTIYVDVGVTPKFSVVPKNPTEVLEGKSLLIDCKAYGIPMPTIQWDKNNIMNGFDRERFQVFENGSLLVTEVLKEDDGRYGCTAGNSGGFIREEVRLIVKSNDQYYSESLDDAVMTRTVSITLSVAAGYMLLVIGLMLWCRQRQLKRKQAYLTELEKENGDEEMKDSGPISNGSAPLLIPNGHQQLKADSCRESVKSDGETGKSTHSSIGGKIASATASIASHKSALSSHSKKSGASGYELLSYPRQDLQFVMLLGHGDFGEVFLAKAKNIVKEKSSTALDGDKEMLVMVKALQTREESALFEYKREIDMYYKLSHENVTKLVKLCRDMDPHYMLLEYSDWGDLKQFLLATRKDNPRKVPKPPPLTMAQILQVISQVALGMEHISNYRFVHKDLATRNCLISTGLKIQVSNPNLCRDTYASEYHKFRNQYIPVRWLPLEAVLEDDYSTKSDIWSFACLVWEVVHQAAIPLSHLSNEKVIESLEKKELLWDPTQIQKISVPQRLQNLLTQCWDANPKNRPSFSSIVITLSEISKESLLNSNEK